MVKVVLKHCVRICENSSYLSRVRFWLSLRSISYKERGNFSQTLYFVL